LIANQLFYQTIQGSISIPCPTMQSDNNIRYPNHVARLRHGVGGIANLLATGGRNVPKPQLDEKEKEEIGESGGKGVADEGIAEREEQKVFGEESAAQSGRRQDQGHMVTQEKTFPEPADEPFFLPLPVSSSQIDSHFAFGKTIALILPPKIEP
jgi:hypothetical protein